MSDQTPGPDQWVDLYGDALFQFAMARVRDGDRAEDLVQETFLAGMRNRSGFDGRSSLLTWLTAILKHKIQDYFRTKWRETTVTDLEPEGDKADWTQTLFDKGGHWQTGQPRSWRRPGQALEDGEFLQTLASCLEKLPGRLADVFTLREIDEVESEEVCKVLGITSTNFWAMMHRARTRLRHCLEANWFQKGAGTT